MKYNDIAKGYDKLYGEEQTKKAKLILQNISVKKMESVII